MYGESLHMHTIQRTRIDIMHSYGPNITYLYWKGKIIMENINSYETRIKLLEYELRNLKEEIMSEIESFAKIDITYCQSIISLRVKFKMENLGIKTLDDLIVMLTDEEKFQELGRISAKEILDCLPPEQSEKAIKIVETRFQKEELTRLKNEQLAKVLSKNFPVILEIYCSIANSSIIKESYQNKFSLFHKKVHKISIGKPGRKRFIYKPKKDYNAVFSPDEANMIWDKRPKMKAVLLEENPSNEAILLAIIEDKVLSRMASDDEQLIELLF